MVVLVVHDLRARETGQTTSELAGQLAGRLVANDLRARGPTGRPAGGKRPQSWQAGTKQDILKITGFQKSQD